jgi:phage terminase large subunit
LAPSRIVLPYAPRVQFLPYHNRQQRFAITVAHRRAGKTVAEVNEGGKKALTINRAFPPPQVAFISPTYKQSKRNAWPYARHYFAPIPGVEFKESELTAVFPNGARYIFAGSDNPDALRGLYLDHASLDEYGDQDPRIWGEVVRPALSDYGGSATFIGSARGRNHFHKLLKEHEHDPDFLVTILRASETGIINADELTLARRTMTPEQYEQEYECSFDAAVKGAYYGKDVQQAEADNPKRITNVPHDKSADTFAAWDLGIGDMMSIWIFQIVGHEWHFIRYYENNGFGLDHYVDWIKGMPFKVHKHFLPHDAEARELQTGKNRVEFLEGREFNCEVVPRHNVDDGINAVRMKFNRFWFDTEKTSRGVDCLRMYRSEFDEKNDTLKPRPLHDWASHGADAFRCAIMGADDKRTKPAAAKRNMSWVV